MSTFNNTFFLRVAVAIILLAHSVGAIIHNDIAGFGVYLSQSGFGALGLALAWAIKLSHVAAAICLLFQKWIMPACLVTIFILIMGIFMVHLKNGWFVVGGGFNGIEYNFLLIFALLTIMFPNGLAKLNNRRH